MIPQVNPCPLSAWTLAVETLAYPQPRLTICSCADGAGVPPPRGAAAGGLSGGAPAPRPAAAFAAPPPRAGAAGAAPPRGAVAAPGTVHCVVVGTPAGAAPPPPNIRTTGTGPVASFGVLSVARIVTFNSGYAELSTRPTSCFVTTAMLPVLPSVVPATVQVTFGIFFGRRPYTSRSNNSTISARRFRHC
jgi:hypothetical protein